MTFPRELFGGSAGLSPASRLGILPRSLSTGDQNFSLCQSGPEKFKPKANSPKKISRNLGSSRSLAPNYIPHWREAGVRLKPAELGSEGIPSQRWQVLPRHLALMPAKSEHLMTSSSERNMTDTPSQKSFFFPGFPESRTARENPLFQWLGG